MGDGESDGLGRRLEGLRYQDVIDGIQDAVIIDDVEGRLVYANKVFFELFGFESTELGNILLENYVAPEWRGRLRDRHDRRVRGEDVPSTFEYEGLKTSGERMWLQVSVLAVYADDELVGTQSAIRDVTESKRTEEALRAQNRTLAELIEVLPLPIHVLDAKATVTTWNAAAEALFGWSAADVLGQDYPLAPGPMAEEHGALLAASIRDGVTLSGLETTRQHKDGTPIDVAIWSAPLRDEAGEIFGSLSVVRDLTALKLLEDELAQAQKMEAIGQLAGGIAHDFNNLLTGILGSGSSLRDTFDGTADQRECIDEIVSSARRGSRLVSQLLTFSRKQVVRPQRVHVEEMIRGLVRWLDRLLEDKVDLRLDLSATEDRVFADPIQLEQVVVNLVLNARDAMPAGGVLTITTETTSQDLPEDLPSGDYVRVSVRDTGTGIDPATLREIFTPFFTTKGPGKGTGLGLATAHTIVMDCGGRITVRSTVGEGTTFTIHLPLRRTEHIVEEPETIPSERPAPLGSGGTVLLVEDDPTVRSTVRRILRAAGYEVVTANDALSAQRLFEGNPDGVSALLSDILMPGMNGPELAAILRATRPDLPVLLMSGFVGDPQSANQLVERAVFIQKPFEPRVLVAQVHRAIAASLLDLDPLG